MSETKSPAKSNTQKTPPTNPIPTAENAPLGAMRTFGTDSREIIKLVIGDLIDQKVDAIVSPANNESLLNTRVAGVIAVKAGPALSRECNKIGKIELGEAVITPAGKLKAKFVIHAACMNYDEHTNEEVLVLSTRNALLRSRENKLQSIAIPPLDTTGQSFPLKRCAELMISEVIRHTEKEATLEEVRFILDDERMLAIFEECLRQI